jgi:hypothetical protein
MIGYFVNLGAPRLGEVVKCTILARYEKVPADKLVGTIVAERAFDVVCLAIVFGLTFLFQFNVIHSLTTNKFRFVPVAPTDTISFEVVDPQWQ